MGLAGKVAMVTGCAGERGIGRAITRRLAAAGADLMLTDVAPTGTRGVPTKPASGWGGLDAVAAEVRSAGRPALTALLDIRSAAQIARVMDRVLQTFGRLDILVNNAAAPPGADRVPVIALSEEAWNAVLDVNLKGTFLCTQAAARLMLRQQIRGRIINIGSDSGRVGAARQAAYCTSKFGLIGFTQSLALELAPAGITVNTICPGAVDTERVDYFGRREDGSYDPEQRAERIRRLGAEVPLGRLATPADVAELAAFLASDAAAYLTGQAIGVNGGVVMR